MKIKNDNALGVRGNPSSHSSLKVLSQYPLSVTGNRSYPMDSSDEASIEGLERAYESSSERSSSVSSLNLEINANPGSPEA